MSHKVNNRFKILLAEKELKEGRPIPYEEIKVATGIAPSTLSAWATNSIKRFDGETIAALCDFLDCNVGDLIVYKKS
jgi:putative transcriptional regulator